MSFIGRLCQESPRARIVVLLSTFDSAARDAAIKAGADRYMVKGLLASELVDAIYQVSNHHG
jgi:DNA-binding NarL/FixJ family response regulator